MNSTFLRELVDRLEKVQEDVHALTGLWASTLRNKLELALKLDSAKQAHDSMESILLLRAYAEQVVSGSNERQRKLSETSYLDELRSSRSNDMYNEVYDRLQVTQVAHSKAVFEEAACAAELRAKIEEVRNVRAVVASFTE